MTSYLPHGLSKQLSTSTDLLRNTLGGLSWQPLVSVSKAAVTSLLGRIEVGTLLVGEGEATTCFGQAPEKMMNGGMKNKGKIVELRVCKESFWVRLFLFGDMGFAEAYMLGEVDCNDLTSFFSVCPSFLQSRALNVKLIP